MCLVSVCVLWVLVGPMCSCLLKEGEECSAGGRCGGPRPTKEAKQGGLTRSDDGDRSNKRIPVSVELIYYTVQTCLYTALWLADKPRLVLGSAKEPQVTTISTYLL